MKPDWFQRIGYFGLLGFVSALQFSIAAANVFLGLSLLMWLVQAITTRRLEVPRFFYPLAAYAALTLISAAFSDDPNASFVDSKQLVLFLVVPMVYELAHDTKAAFVVQVPPNHPRRCWRCWTRTYCSPVRALEVEDEHAEARFGASEIAGLVDEGVNASEIAVFYRTNAQSRVLEDILVRQEIPYQVIGGPRFYERAEVKD